MKLFVRFASAVVAITALGCTESTVPHDQIVLGLAQIDGVTIPTMVETGQGGKILVQEGLLAEGVSGTCDFLIRFFSSNALSPINGTVPNCKLTAGKSVTVKIDLTTQVGVGEHLYIFR